MAEPINIGPRGVRRRARLGALGFAAAAILFAVEIVRDLATVWTLGLAPLLWMAGLGAFQARGKT